MKFNMKKMALALSSLVFLGAASQAVAFPAFSIAPTAVGGTHAAVTGLDTIKGGASELITPISASSFAGSGILTLDGFYAGATDKFAPTLSDNFSMYISFNLVATITSGSLGAPGSTYALTTLNFQLFADPGDNNTYTSASATSTSATPASVTGSGDDVLLASGSLLPGPSGYGTATLNSDASGGSSGAALNSTESFTLTATGKNFFYYPSPFYTLAFDEFNNTGVQVGPGGVEALNGGSGSINFAPNVVPEPDSLALFGIAAVGLGLAAKRRRKA